MKFTQFVKEYLAKNTDSGLTYREAMKDDGVRCAYKQFEADLCKAGIVRETEERPKVKRKYTKKPKIEENITINEFGQPLEAPAQPKRQPSAPANIGYTPPPRVAPPRQVMPQQARVPTEDPFYQANPLLAQRAEEAIKQYQEMMRTPAEPAEPAEAAPPPLTQKKTVTINPETDVYADPAERLEGDFGQASRTPDRTVETSDPALASYPVARPPAPAPPSAPGPVPSPKPVRRQQPAVKPSIKIGSDARPDITQQSLSRKRLPYEPLADTSRSTGDRTLGEPEQAEPQRVRLPMRIWDRAGEERYQRDAVGPLGGPLPLNIEPEWRGPREDTEYTDAYNYLLESGLYSRHHLGVMSPDDVIDLANRIRRGREQETPPVRRTVDWSDAPQFFAQQQQQPTQDDPTDDLYRRLAQLDLPAPGRDDEEDNAVVTDDDEGDDEDRGDDAPPPPPPPPAQTTARTTNEVTPQRRTPRRTTPTDFTSLLDEPRTTTIPFLGQQRQQPQQTTPVATAVNVEPAPGPVQAYAVPADLLAEIRSIRRDFQDLTDQGEITENDQRILQNAVVAAVEETDENEVDAVNDVFNGGVDEFYQQLQREDPDYREYGDEEGEIYGSVPEGFVQERVSDIERREEEEPREKYTETRKRLRDLITDENGVRKEKYKDIKLNSKQEDLLQQIEKVQKEEGTWVAPLSPPFKGARSKVKSSSTKKETKGKTLQQQRREKQEEDLKAKYAVAVNPFALAPPTSEEVKEAKRRIDSKTDSLLHLEGPEQKKQRLHQLITAMKANKAMSHDELMSLTPEQRATLVREASRRQESYTDYLARKEEEKRRRDWVARQGREGGGRGLNGDKQDKLKKILHALIDVSL